MCVIPRACLGAHTLDGLDSAHNIEAVGGFLIMPHEMIHYRSVWPPFVSLKINEVARGVCVREVFSISYAGLSARGAMQTCREAVEVSNCHAYCEIPI